MTPGEDAPAEPVGPGPNGKHGSLAVGEAGPGVIAGRVGTAARTAVPGADVLVFAVGLGSETEIARGTADADGRYAVEYDVDKLQKVGLRPDFRVHAALGGNEIGTSDVVYNAPPRVAIDVIVAPGTLARADEHSRLVEELAPHLEASPDRRRLADLEETDERPDITYLANKTGWDARAVAMAAAADRMAAGTKLPSDLFYALFRAGLPANADALARTTPDLAVDIWKTSIEGGVIDKKLARGLPRYAEMYAAYASGELLQQPAAVGVSSLGDMLDVAGLNDDEKQQVARLYTKEADRADFWSNVESEIGADAATRVATAGKLGYLTVNNAPLMRKLAETVKRDDPVALIGGGLYSPKPGVTSSPTFPCPTRSPATATTSAGTAMPSSSPASSSSAIRPRSSRPWSTAASWPWPTTAPSRRSPTSSPSIKATSSWDSARSRPTSASTTSSSATPPWRRRRRCSASTSSARPTRR